jgi:hypothetical protein
MNSRIKVGASVFLAVLSMAAFAKTKTVELALSAKQWNNDKVIKWKKDGAFKLNKEAYGAVETLKRYFFTQKAQIKFNVMELSDADYSVQLQMFDVDGNYIGHFDLLKNDKKKGAITIDIENYKSLIPDKTYDYAIKIWIGGAKDAYIKISGFSYTYEVEDK